MLSTVQARDRRRVETPNATMTTLASPTLGSTAGLSMWQVEMPAGAQGPAHVFDSEQLWTVMSGALSISTPDGTAELAAGDTAILPAGAQRQIHATSAVRLLVCGHGHAVVAVPGEEAPRGTPEWIA